MISKILKTILTVLTYPFHRGRFIILIVLAFGCKKDDKHPDDRDTYTITIDDKPLPAGDSLFFSYDYWFYFQESPAIQINRTSVNSKYAGTGYVSDSINRTKREYVSPYTKSVEYKFTKGNPPRFVYRLAHYYKIKDQKIWAISDKGNAKTVTIQKNGEVLFTDGGAGERSSNMQLQ